MSKQIIVVGGGITGLITAYYAIKKGHEVILYESQKQCGGLINTKYNNTYNIFYELGANSLRAGQYLQSIIDDFSLPYLQSEIRSAYLLSDHNLYQPWQLLNISLILKIVSRINDLKNLSPNITVYDFGQYLGDQYLVDNYLYPICAGIYAISPDQVLMRSIFPELWPCLQGDQSLLVYLSKKVQTRICNFQGGLQTLIQSLSQYIQQYGILHYQRPIHSAHNLRSEYPHAQIIFTIPAYIGADILKMPLLREIRYTKASMSIYTADEYSHYYQGLGFLATRDMQDYYQLMGVLHNSNIFPQLYKQPLLTCFHHNNTDSNLSSALQQIYKLRTKPILLDYHHWEQALPIYDLRRFELIAQIRDHLPAHSYILGNYTDGIAIESICKACYELIESFSI